jgi:putative tributyrin esterase
MALLHVDFFSDVLGMCTQMDVILPEATHGQIGMEGKAADNGWKTLYLLHGMSDDHTIWQRRTSIERYAADKGIAVVMPTTHLGWYTDMHLGFDYFTFITQELPAICRNFFPNMSSRREDTYAAGLSMGGYGALKCGLRAGGTFSRVATLSGAMDVTEVFSDDPGRNAFWEDIFGPKEQVKGSFNDLFQAAEDMKASPQRPDVYMWCGTEDFLYSSNVRMHEHLVKLGYNIKYEESPGDHQWKYWDEKIQTVLDWLIPGKEDM